MKRLQFCLVLLCTLLLALGAFAQVQNGQFTGEVTDPSGAAIANANVTVTNTGTNLTQKVTTNQAGLYTAKELPVGSYKIVVEAKGFKTSQNTSLTLNAGTIQHVDFKLQLGEAREVVEVSGEATQVNVEDSKLASTVTSTQVENLPLNGRNVYDLVQLAPGAVNVRGVMSENGANTVVNGLRENFNGFLINGSSNKGLSGGVVTTPIEDTVQEFQQLTLNMSSQYGNSAGSVTNLVTKSGTNEYHGSGWWFNRNDWFDANKFFLNQSDTPRQALRFNQYGGTFGGPILKDKLFFFVSYQGNKFRESAPPTTVTVESPEFRQAVETAFANSTAALLYGGFGPTVPGSPAHTGDGRLLDLNTYILGTPDLADTDPNFIAPGSFSGSSFGSYVDYLNPCNDLVRPDLAAKFAVLMGVTTEEHDAINTACPGQAPAVGPGAFSRTAPFIYNTISFNGSQNQNNTGSGNLFNGWELGGKIDWNASAKDRVSFALNWNRLTDRFGFPNTTSNSNGRGNAFLNPTLAKSPNGQLSWVHTFSPTVLNEARVGYALNITGDVTVATAGIPDLRFDDGMMGFGSYSGYPQMFHENIYSYSDMVSISHGKHNFKIGVDFRRNIENSEFSVARPSYYFRDALFFAADAPYTQTAGVDPGIIDGQGARLSSNVRHWRNLEMGAYFQDDWKVTRNLTLNLGLRYDLYQRHHELNDLVTTFIKGPGSNFIDNISTGEGQIKSASFPADTPGCSEATGQNPALAQIAGECGPGGFTTAKSLGKGDHNNIGPSVGFAWDMFGDAKSSLRGGFGVAYEGTLYNPLSNSRWNLPYYSFNSASNFQDEDVQTVIYGPYVCNPTCVPDGTATPTFTGPPTNPNMGTGAQATGNLTGWDPSNANLAFLTGIVFPEGIRDPYVYNYYLGYQREIMPKLVVEANYVGTAGHKLFRAQNVNRIAGGRLPGGACVEDNLGRTLCSQVPNPSGRLNPNFGTLRVWQNVVNSNYNALQLSVKRQMSHGMAFNANYTWGHSIDAGSTWHSGATSSNGAGAGEGYTTDVTLPQLDRGNSIFDVRQRLVANYVWELPWLKEQHGLVGHILGGWQYNGIISWQTGAHWEPWDNRSRSLNTEPDGSGATCTAADVAADHCFNVGGDYNLDGVANDRPNSTVKNFNPSHDQWANGWGNSAELFSTPCLGCVGNEGRNTFVGPSYISWETSLFKNIKITERVNMQFRAEAFNVLNHTNFQLPGAGGATNMRIKSSTFGQAGGTFNPRNLQFGLKIRF